MALGTVAAVAQQPAPAAPTAPSKPQGVVIETTAPSEPTLKPGSPVKLEALASAKWVQGEAPKEFEAGKVYMFECWATWCGPCVAAIPHVNDLHKKYHDKGLRVFGINVWEDGFDKVADFVKKKGDGMSYPVAYTGRGSDFEKQWLNAAGVRGIPHAFIVRDGKLVLKTHPSQITDSLIESLLAGEEESNKAVEQINAAASSREKTVTFMRDFRQAAAKGDQAAMESAIAEMEKLDPKSPYLPSLRFELLTARKDWEGAAKMLKEMPAGPGRQMTLAMTANKISMQQAEDYPQSFVAALAETYAEQIAKNQRGNPMEYMTLATLQWQGGEKENAVASAKKAADSAKQNAAAGSYPSAPFEKYAKSLEEGKLPTMQEFSGWVRETMNTGKEKEGAMVPAAKIQPASP
jgi:thiol-disulfide isomerase/thioredoxin